MRVRSKLLRANRQNYKHDFHLEASWPIEVHFRWPCLYDFSCMVGGSSDSCCLCQFLKDSAVQTALSHNMRPESGRRFPLVYMCFGSLSKQRVTWGIKAVEFAFAIYLYTFYMMMQLCFNFFLLLEGVTIIGGTANIFANKIRAVFISFQVPDSAPFDALHGLLPC